jgi:hypothetical protein
MTASKRAVCQNPYEDEHPIADRAAPEKWSKRAVVYQFEIWRAVKNPETGIALSIRQWMMEATPCKL